MSRWIRVAALAIAAIAVVILAYAVLTPEPQTDGTDRMGMWGNHMTYSSANVGLIAISTVTIVVALMVVLLWKEYEPLPPSMAPLPPPASIAEPQGEKEEPPKAARERHQPPTPSPDEAAERNYLVLRLLTGDERLMFKAIMDSGGEALQKDLIHKTKMSHAKVSRLLDKLSQKGVVAKERHGATNKVRIKQD
jgi:uncharacterized membrane protein